MGVGFEGYPNMCGSGPLAQKVTQNQMNCLRRLERGLCGGKREEKTRPDLKSFEKNLKTRVRGGCVFVCVRLGAGFAVITSAGGPASPLPTNAATQLPASPQWKAGVQPWSGDRIELMCKNK